MHYKIKIKPAHKFERGYVTFLKEHLKFTGSCLDLLKGFNSKSVAASDR